ncbi:AbrB/MazE/SpoVT family DNA-binding domain-containing protein [uncultured Desulfovibrio sp.]|uniref:AbrB/MazE/SpoVT family DNA-binding domain-containing protein n=1 Tax=uncultured Desulfovibrio sp. TaxID=167968 RepID=UPI0003A54CCC|nr:AbrB/MazE/SpoVT family DNA-binding domain-containing protein [uncultured Desulfovibrio sp.]
METHITAVGNSKGLRIPKALLAQCGIHDRVRLTVTDAGLLVSPVNTPRHGWEEALQANPAQDDTAEFAPFDAVESSFDASEWTWPQKP